MFVAFGMLMAEIEHADRLKLSIKNEVLAGGIYIVKVGISLIGGGSTSQRFLICQRFGSCLS